MIKISIGVTLLLCVGWAPPIQAQAQTFNVGDYVDAQYSPDNWLPCKVLKPALTIMGAVYGYTVTCVPIAVNGPQQFEVRFADVRARTPNADEKKVEAETAAALTRQPKGAGLGVKFGTREPQACASRTAPAHGAPSADQARQYVLCEQEVAGPGQISLITNVKVQVAPTNHPPNQLVLALHGSDIDLREGIWEIRGSYTQYLCAELSLQPTVFSKTHNCNVTDMPTATGYCYKNTFGDWHCGMLDVAHAIANTRTNQLPPDGN